MSRKKKKPDNPQQSNKGINFNKQIQPYKTIKTSLKSIIKTPEIQKESILANTEFLNEDILFLNLN